MNYSDPINQNQIENLMQTLENTSYVLTPLYTESWLRSFLSYIERNNDYLNLTLDTEQNFLDVLKEVRNQFFLFQFYFFFNQTFFF